MEKMFGSMMKMFMNGMAEDDKRKMTECFEKMSSFCPCCSGKEVPEGGKQAMTEKIRSCCGGKTE
jgi:hypothetical protein